jgi:hypothetical protein
MILGREVKSVSLGSENNMKKLGVTEGCLVEVGLSNDVTPKIYQVVEDTVGTGSCRDVARDVTEVPVPDVSEVADAPTLEGHTDITDGTDSIAVAETTVTEPTVNQAAETPSPCQASDTEGTGTSVPSADAGTARMEPVPVVSPAAAEVEPSPVTDGIGNQAIDIVVVSPRPTERERNAAARRRRREQREAQRLSYEARLEQEAREAEEYARQQERRKIFAAVGAAAVTLVMIYFFGLLGPAVFGLLAGGLLKG